MHLNNKELPFQEIGDYPSTYSSTSILCCLIEGLGYLYYWATASLNQSDLDYRPSDDSWTTLQIIGQLCNSKNKFIAKKRMITLQRKINSS